MPSAWLACLTPDTFINANALVLNLSTCGFAEHRYNDVSYNILSEYCPNMHKDVLKSSI